MDQRSQFRIHLEAAKRLFMVNALSGVLPLYIVTEYPKSGGTWISQVLSECLGIPFPRNRPPKLESCLMHGHMTFSPLMKNVVVVQRDGRDVMISWYYHMLFQHDRNTQHLVEKTRQRLAFPDFEDIEENLPKFIEYVFESEQRSRSPFHFTWSQFVDSWHDKDVPKVSYEEMIEGPVRAVQNVIGRLGVDEVDAETVATIVDKYSFQAQSQRAPGQEDKSSFLRRGKPGDWKNKFNRRAAEVFDQLAGTQLVQLGYEPDTSWVRKLL